MYTYPHGPESKPSTEQRKFSYVSSKKKSYHSMPIDWIFFFSFLRFVEMPYLVSLISFTPYPRIAFFFAFICPICVNCFYKVFIGG